MGQMKWGSFDTETVNRPGGGHACLLIKTGPEFLEFPANFDAIFNFLKGGKYTCWNMNFDAQAILHEKYIPWKILSKLGLFNRVKFGKYDLNFVPGKFCEVKRGKERFILYDLAQFYAMSLRDAAATYLEGVSKDEIPNGWYREIDRALMDMRRARVYNYAARDVEIADRLRELLAKSFDAVGVKTDKLVSSGSLAKRRYSKALKSVHCPRWMNDLWKLGFYGGRIETKLLGRVDGCRLFDINSAYPSVISTLPKFDKSEFIRSGIDWKYNERALYGLYFVRVVVPPWYKWGPLAVRNKNTVYYPTGIFTTWCSLPAIRSLLRNSIKFQVIKSWEFIDHGRSGLIFEGIEELYLSRKNPVLKLSAKLLLNSIYGNLCEMREDIIEAAIDGRIAGNTRVENLDIYGRYVNIFLAAHITETIRMELWEKLNILGDAAIFCATDSILIKSGVEFPGKIGDKLGEWGLKGDYSKGVVLGCGRYFLDSDNSENIRRLRGFDINDAILSKIRNCPQRSIALPVFRAASLKQWVLGGCLGDYNVLANYEMNFRIDDDKRKFNGKFDRIKDAFNSTLDSETFVRV